MSRRGLTLLEVVLSVTLLGALFLASGQWLNAVAVLGSHAEGPVRWERVGHYAVQPTWADGHETGIFSYDFLRQIGDHEDQN